MLTFYCYNKETGKEYMFKDNSFYAVKMQKHINKSNGNVSASISKSQLKLLKIAYELSKIKQ